MASEKWRGLVELESLSSTSLMGSYSGGIYTRNAIERRVTKCQFADDSALLATTRSGAESSAIGYQRTSSVFGLKVSLPETK